MLKILINFISNTHFFRNDKAKDIRSENRKISGLGKPEIFLFHLRLEFSASLELVTQLGR